MATHVLPPWRGGEGGSELDRTRKDKETGDKPRAGDGLGDIFGDDNDNGSEEEGRNGRPAAASRRGSEKLQSAIGTGNGNGSSEESRHRRGRSRSTSGAGKSKGLEGDGDRVAAQENGFKERGLSVQHSGEVSNRVAGASHLEGNSANSANDGGTEDPALTDCSSSSNDDLSCSSPQTQGPTTRNGNRLRHEHPTVSSKQADVDDSPKPTSATLSDWRRHSSGSTPSRRGVQGIGTATESGHGRKNVCFAERPVSGGRRVSDTPLSPRSGNYLARAETRSGASMCEAGEPQPGLKRGESHGDASGRCSGDADPASAQQRGYSAAKNIAASPTSSPTATNQMTAPGEDVPPRENSHTLAKTVGSSAALPLNETLGLGGDHSPPSSHRRRGTIVAGQSSQQPFVGEAIPTGGASPGVEGGGANGTDLLDAKTNLASIDTSKVGGALEDPALAVDPPEIATDEIPSAGPSVPSLTSATAGGESTYFDADFGPNKKKQGDEETEIFCAGGEGGRSAGAGKNIQQVPPSSSSEQHHGGRRPSAVTTASADTKRGGEGDNLSGRATTAANVVSPSTVGSGRERENMPDGLAVSNPNSVATLPRTTAESVHSVLATTTQTVKSGADMAAVENNRNASIGKSEGMVRPSLEAITEAPGGESSGDSYGGGSRSGITPAALDVDAAPTLDMENGGVAMRKPFCLSPTNVMRQARGSSATCRERERIAARIQLSAGIGVSAAAAAATSAKGVPPDSLPWSSSVTGGGFDGGFTMGSSYGGGGGSMSASGSPDSYNCPAENARSLPAGRSSASPSFSRRASSPEREERGVRWATVGGATTQNGQCSSSSPSLRFHLPSSETKTAPLCGAGGSTSLYDGSVANTSRPAGERGREGAWCFSRVDYEAAFTGGVQGGMESTGMIVGGDSKKDCGLPRLDEEQLAVSFVWIASADTRKCVSSHPSRRRYLVSECGKETPRSKLSNIIYCCMC